MTLTEILGSVFSLLVAYRVHTIVISCGCALNLSLLSAFLFISASRNSSDITRKEEEQWKRYK